jgi:AraC-like DNA-binding protein
MYEISDELGFDEPANFAGFFKRFTGMSVKRFKQIQKKSKNSNMFG